MYLIFRSPQVQTWLVGKTTALLSHQLNARVSIRAIDLSWFLDLVLEDVEVQDQTGRPILYTSRLTLDVQNISLRQRTVNLNNLSLHNAAIRLVKYKNDTVFNYQFLADYFSGSGDTSASRPWSFSLKNLEIANTYFLYSNQNKGYINNSMDYDHLMITNINLLADHITIKGDSINIPVKKLAAKEKSGFTLHDLTGIIVLRDTSFTARNLHVMTPGSDLDLDLLFRYPGIHALNDFIDSVYMQGDFNPSILNLNEIRYFAPELATMDNILHFEGLAKGRVSSLRVKNFNLAYGNNTVFKGDVTMDGLPDIDETFIHAKVKSLTTDFYDIANIRLPDNQIITLPDEFKDFGLIDVRGFFTGFFYDFVSSADFSTAFGKLETDLSLKTGKNGLITYSGKFNTINWDLGKTVKNTDLAGALSVTSNIDGTFLNSHKHTLNLNAVVDRFVLLKNEFNNIRINGQLTDRLFNGNLHLRDELAKLDFNGIVDFSDTIPGFNFTASLNDAYLHRLNLWQRDSTAHISTKMDLNFKGSNIDNLLGYLRFDSTQYTEINKDYLINNIELSTTNIGANTKKLSLKSDLLDASVYGVFTFTELYSSVTNIVQQYLPSLQLKDQKLKTITGKQLFEYSVQLKNTKPLTDIFVPDLQVLSEASIFGSYNSDDNTVIFNGLADSFTYKGVRFDEWYIRGKNTGASLHMVTGLTDIVLNEQQENDAGKIGIENFIFTLHMQGDSIRYNLDFDDDIPENRNTGHIKGYLAFDNYPQIHGRFTDFSLMLNNNRWTATQDKDIIIDSTFVFVENLIIASRNQKMRLSGSVSENPDDVLSLSVSELDVSEADLLINVDNVDLDGIITGTVSLRDLYNTQRIEAEVDVKNFAFNKEPMGDAKIKSSWNHDISALDVTADIVYKGNVSTHLPISAIGKIYTASHSKDNFDLDVKVSNYKLASLNPFLKGIASNIKGYANGDLKLTGTFNKPVITGELELLRTQMKIDYVNVTYSFANKVLIEPTHISARDVVVYDSLGNTALMNFDLEHNNFRNIMMNIDLNANKINALNTSYVHNNLFYGKAFGTGNINIRGSFEDISINIDAASNTNTSVYIPINLAVDASENEFIRFKTNGAEEEKTEPFILSDNGVDVNMNLRVTRDASLQLFLPENIGNIKGNGSGVIQVGINKQGEMSMFGDYHLNEGSFLFTLGNVINRSFTIENGSKISFNGSPYDAEIDLSAVYKVKASISGISDQYAGVSVPVDCIIRLKNDLYNPDIAFSIRLPESNNEMNQVVFAAIDTSNQVIMTQQMVSLLVLKTFAFNSPLASSVGSSSIEVITDQLSNMLSQISDNIDIGVKYRSGNALVDEEVEVALSTSLFNDRVTIDGNVGMYTQGNTQNTNNIVGDVVVDVKITPDGRFRVKAFNKSNQFDISSSYYSAYKQGIGVYYRYEFDKFSEIFKRRKKRPDVIQ